MKECRALAQLYENVTLGNIYAFLGNDDEVDPKQVSKAKPVPIDLSESYL